MVETLEKVGCLVWHPKTDEERAAVMEQIEYYKTVGDPMGVAISVAMLSNKDCPVCDKE